MSNLRETYLDQRDLADTGFQRTHDRYVFVNWRGKRYVNVSKSRMRQMNWAQREVAVVVMRTRPNNYPATVEGAAVRSVLADLHAARFTFVVERVARWADGDPVGFVHRAVRDSGALLNVLLPAEYAL